MLETSIRDARGAILLCAAVLLLGSCAAREPHAGIATEQGRSMARMLLTVEAIKSYALGEAPRAQAEPAAAELVAWSGRMGELFPPEQTGWYVDLTPEMARNASEAMLASSRRLAEVVRTGDRLTVGEQLMRTERDGCGTCHRQPYSPRM